MSVDGAEGVYYVGLTLDRFRLGLFTKNQAWGTYQIGKGILLASIIMLTPVIFGETAEKFSTDVFLYSMAEVFVLPVISTVVLIRI